MTNSYSKPLPVSQPESDRYWEGARSGELMLQRCDDCGSAQFYPRVLCAGCGSRNIAWTVASGRATLFTFSVVHLPPHQGFAGDVPYVAAIVELEEGPRMPTRIVGVDPDPENLSIGMPLEVVFEEVTETVTLPMFRPVD